MTEIEKLIKKITAQMKVSNPAQRNSLHRILEEAKESLPAERQAIEEAYRTATTDATDALFSGNSKHQDATDYFNKTFKK